PSHAWAHGYSVTSLGPIGRIASTLFWPCETRTSPCRNFATISSGLYRFLTIAVLLDAKTYLKSDHFNGGGSLIMAVGPNGDPKGRPLAKAYLPRLYFSKTARTIVHNYLVHVLDNSGEDKTRSIGYTLEWIVSV